MGIPALRMPVISLVPVFMPSSFDSVRPTFLDASTSIAQTMQIERDEVHIWHIDLARPIHAIEALRRFLSPDELQRTDRFHFARDAHRFIVARASLRSILSSYVGLAPADLRFTYGRHGKPSLVVPSKMVPSSALAFNLSHSEDTALGVVACRRSVGIDIERMRSWPEAESIVRGQFTAGEQAAFAALPDTEKDATFVRWWTRKEAYIKALGTGHSEPLDTIDMLHGPDSPHWMVGDILGLPGFCAALVVGATDLDDTAT